MIQIDWNPPKKTLRNFGLIGLVAFSAFALMIHFHVWVFAKFHDTPTVRYVLFGLAAYCGATALVAPMTLKWLYVGMTVASYPIGFVVSYIVVGVMFFLIITPMAFIFRLIGRDGLHRKFEPAASTYWIPRRPPQSVKRYFRQF
jgi:hypothetical protein